MPAGSFSFPHSFRLTPFPWSAYNGYINRATKPQTKGKTVEFDTYVQNVKGINIMTRKKMLRAFDADDAGTRLDELINHSPINHIKPEVRKELNRHWSENFNETSRFKP